MAGKDALTLLHADHQKVKDAFEAFEQLEDGEYESKQKLAEEICNDLKIHTRIEEEVFYPAFRNAAAKDTRPLANEAKVEHDSAKALIAQIEKMSPEDELFDAEVKVLSEHIKHHIKEEEEQIFPRIRSAQVDLVALGRELEAHRQRA